MILFTPTADSNQAALNNYLPALSNFQFGNSIFANLGMSNAVISGNVPLAQNEAYARTEPITLDLPVGATRVGDQNLPQQLDQGSRLQNTGVLGDGENRLLHLFKLQFVALIALVLLAVGLYLLSQKTSIGQKVQGKVLEAAEVAALV